MPFNGAGVFTRLYNWAADALAGISMEPARFDADANDMATALTNCMTRNGQSPATANISLGGFKLTNVANGVNSGDGVNIGQLGAGTGTTLIGFIQNGTGAVARTASSKLTDIVSDRDFGTIRDGTDSDAAAIQKAHDYLESLSGGGVLEISSGPPLKFLAGDVFIWNPNKVRILGGGVIWDVSAATTSVVQFITLRQTNTDPNLRAAYNRAHAWEATIFLGPGAGAAAVPNVECISLADLNPIGGTVYSCAGVTFRDCVFTNWWRDVVYGNGAFLTTFDNCTFNISAGITYDASHLISAGTNGGENIKIRGGYIGKPTGTCLRNQNPNSSVYLEGVSLDYSTCMIDAQAGCTYANGVYLENNNDLDHWVKVTGQNTFVSFQGQVTLTGAKSTYEIFYSDPSCTNGGLDIDIAREFGPYAYPLSMVGGTGRYLYREAANGNAAVHPAIGQGANMVGNGTFNSAQLTDGALAGTTLPAIVTLTTAPGFTKSLKLQGQSGGTAPQWLLLFPCLPGQFFCGSVWYQTSALAGTGSTFFIGLNFLDAGGTSLGGATALAVTTNVAAGTFALLSSQTAAPPGTRSVQLQINIFGTTSGAPIAYIGNLIAGVANA